jgi:two-component system, cell cycle sensor histidine kinase and response regulator CckA
MPRDASPCGTVISRDKVLLFNEVARYFPALRNIEPRIYENLLAPWHVNGKAVGILWAIGHTPEHRFDAEDARLLQILSRFASAVHQMVSALEAANTWRESLERCVEERTRTLSEANEALRKSEEKYRVLFTSMDEGYILVDVIFDKQGALVDTLCVEANPAAVKMTGAELVGRRISEIGPSFESHWFETFGRVAQTGVGERHEYSAAPLDA